MERLDHICENYLVCWDREMGLPEDERCPHIVPHAFYPMCDGVCVDFGKRDVHCREIILKD